MNKSTAYSFIFSLILTLVLICPGNSPASATSLPPMVIPENFGVNVSADQLQERDLELIRETGFKYVRIDLWWDHVEKEKGVYDFSGYEKLFDKLGEYDLKAIVILAYGNPLYERYTSVRTEAGADAFANYAKAAVRKFKDYDIIWEIWNEPDSPVFWKPEPDMGEYAKLLKKTYVAVKSEDPDAICIGPAIHGQEDMGLWKELFGKNILNYVDAISIHLYRETKPETALTLDINPLRKLMGQYGKGNMPIISSEWGYSLLSFYSFFIEDWQDKSREELIDEIDALGAGKKRLSDELQEAYAKRILLTTFYARTPVSILYNWRDYCSDKYESECTFGLLKQDFSPRDSYNGVKKMLRALKGMHFVSKLDSNPDDVVLLFSDGNKYKAAAWTMKRTTRSHQITLPGNKKIMINYNPVFVDVNPE